MRQTKRWIVAMTMTTVMTMAVPATAKAAGGRGGAREAQRMTSSMAGDRIAASSRAFASWLHGLLSAVWGATRGTIIPGGFGGGETTSTELETDLVSGGA